jgi:hypothetical protein
MCSWWCHGSWSRVSEAGRLTLAKSMTLDELRSIGFDRSELDEEGSIRVRCSQCEALVINGIPCHESNCPNSFRDYEDDLESDLDDDEGYDLDASYPPFDFDDPEI